MTDEQPEKGTKENPLTREDVKAKIKEHGGPKGLDLSENVFEEAIDLSDLDLHGIILKGSRFPTHFEGDQLMGAKFNGSDLFGADLRSINFKYAQFTMFNNQPTYLVIADLRGSSLLNTNFQGADLTRSKFGGVEEAGGYPAAMPDHTDFRGANLFGVNFKGCYFYGSKFEGAYIRGADIFDAHLEDVDWGNYKIGEETGEEKKRDFYSAENIYRRLKQWYTNAGRYDIAGEFFFREMTAQRNGIKWWPQPRHRLWSKFVSLICGYGERPLRVIGWAASVVLVSALVYFIAGSVWEWWAFWNSLYFSAVSFTALGYGSWLGMTNDWIKGIGTFESFIGVFTMALFLITFVRKMTR